MQEGQLAGALQYRIEHPDEPGETSVLIFGLKIEDERRLKAIRESLMAVLAEPARPGSEPIEIAIAG